MMRSRVAPLLVLALGVVGALSAGCGAQGTSSQLMSEDASMLYSCATETRAMPYMPGMTETSAKGAYMATLMSSVPGPPVKGNDSWTIQIADMNGTPVDGLTINANPY